MEALPEKSSKEGVSRIQSLVEVRAELPLWFQRIAGAASAGAGVGAKYTGSKRSDLRENEKSCFNPV